jgi:hypothetical protein
MEKQNNLREYIPALQEGYPLLPADIAVKSDGSQEGFFLQVIGGIAVWASLSTPPTDIALPNTELLIGGVDGKAHAQSLTGDASITNAGVMTLTHILGIKLDASIGTPFTNAILMYSGNPSIGYVAAEHITGTAVAGDVTLVGNGTNFDITTESLTTAAGATYTLTVHSGQLTSSTNPIPIVTLGDSTTGIPHLVSYTRSGGAIVLVIQNIDSTNPFNGTLKVNFMGF